MPHRKVVLVIDNDDAIVRLYQRILGSRDYRVVSCSDALCALERIRFEKIDLMLTDILLPGMDGFDLVRRARQIQPGLAVVIITGYGSMEFAIQALRQGVDGLVLKPITRGDELVESVTAALEERRRKEDAARVETLRPLFGVIESLLSETDPKNLAGLATQNIYDFFQCNHVGFYRHDEVTDSYILLSGIGDLPVVVSLSEKTMIGWTHINKKPLFLNRDGPGDPVFQTDLEKHGLTSVICMYSEKPYRFVVFIGRDEGQPGFEGFEVEILSILIRQMRVAMENAGLYNELLTYVLLLEESQRALIQSEKLAAIGRLMASIAHEVNNPLQSLQNILHLAAQPEYSFKQRQEYLRMAQIELDRLSGVVQRLLEFYRPAVEELKPVNITTLIENVLNLLSYQLKMQSITVYKKFNKDLPMIDAVADQIRQVLFNLILNAMDAMPKGGELAIRVDQRYGCVHVEIEDSGPGIPDTLKKKIFQPFISTKPKGTGLGLSISYDIMEAHGGSIQASTGKSGGACFKLTFPIPESG